MEGNEMKPLAPSGISPWNHKVENDNGCLVLYWMKGKEEAVRAFTLEETVNVLDFLHQHRNEIIGRWHQSMMS
jgi:hypothetical protein